MFSYSIFFSFSALVFFKFCCLLMLLSSIVAVNVIKCVSHSNVMLVHLMQKLIIGLTFFSLPPYATVKKKYIQHAFWLKCIV